MRRIIYNEDGNGLMDTNLGRVKEDLESWVDRPFSRIPIDTYAWCTATPDICMHNSKVGEVYFARFKDSGNLAAADTSELPYTFSSYPNLCSAAMEELHSNGMDVLRIVTDRAHCYGAEVVASIRMSDTHHKHPDQANPMVPQFLLDHPEWVIKRLDGIQETAMDYSFPEVREYRLAILRELAEDYDIDGIELDFVRFSKHFACHEAPFKIEIMTDFVKKVRSILDEATKKRGCKRLILGVQVQESLYLCHLSGLEPRKWVQNGWIDYIIQCAYGFTDPQIPVYEFAEFCKGSNCTHHVRMTNAMGGSWRGEPFMKERKIALGNNLGYRGMVLTPEEARGVAANIYGFGADGIGLWNICDYLTKHRDFKSGISHDEFVENIFAWIEQIVSPDKVFSGKRSYHFVPLYKESKIQGNYPFVGLRTGPTGAVSQIVNFHPGFRHIYRFLMADGRHGERLKGKMHVRILQSTLEDKFVFDLNGQKLDNAKIRRRFVPDEELSAVWYEIDLAGCPEFIGNNELGMTLTNLSEDRENEKNPYMEELEITVEPD